MAAKKKTAKKKAEEVRVLPELVWADFGGVMRALVQFARLFLLLPLSAACPGSPPGGDIGDGDMATRDRQSNIDHALARMEALLVEALHIPKKRKATKPSRRAKQRRLDAKKQRRALKKQLSSGWD